ncbi:hypothetical protein NQ317_005488, partial [Molorchus minor]
TESILNIIKTHKTLPLFNNNGGRTIKDKRSSSTSPECLSTFTHLFRIDQSKQEIDNVMAPSKSCDTFVVLPPLTKYGVVFGKNSDRPQGEIQEVVYFPASESSDPVKCECTYIEVESIGSTKAIILSKPNWMWGAEMGANECGWQ